MYKNILKARRSASLLFAKNRKPLKKIRLKSNYSRMLADVITPVSIYLKLRDKYANSILLESSDYHGAENSYSYICCNPISTFTLKDSQLEITWPNGMDDVKTLGNPKEAIAELNVFMNSFQVEEGDFKFITNGLFGYVGYDAVQYFEDITFSDSKKDEYHIPDIVLFGLQEHYCDRPFQKMRCTSLIIKWKGRILKAI